MTLLYSNDETYNNKLDIIKKGGAESLHIVSDFDRTLTKAKVGEEQTNSSFARLRQASYFPPEYNQKANELYTKYYQYEIDPNLDMATRAEKMMEWWQAHLHLLIQYGVSKDIFNQAVQSGIYPREGLPDLLKIAAEKKIPFLIFSAGLGDFIKTYLEKENLLTPNVQIISNLFVFDEQGKAIAIRDGRVIHPFNKHVIEVANSPYAKEVKNRKNVILLGDTVGDIGMTAGFEHDAIIKVGFMNGLFEQEKLFKKHFDVIIEEDIDLSFVVDLLKSI
jgi:cytosolic 5'-nucleotidase 3